jgi:hypothetical protein
MDVSVTPAQDEGVWKISALDEKGKVVGSEERQLLLLREKPQTIVVNDLYCMTKPVAMKMEIALDKNGQPKVATAAGGGTGNQPGGAGQGGGGSAPPSGSANPPPPGGGGAGDGRGGGGGGAALPRREIAAAAAAMRAANNPLPSRVVRLVAIEITRPAELPAFAYSRKTHA